MRGQPVVRRGEVPGAGAEGGRGGDQAAARTQAAPGAGRPPRPLDVRRAQRRRRLLVPVGVAALPTPLSVRGRSLRRGRPPPVIVRLFVFLFSPRLSTITEHPTHGTRVLHSNSPTP